mgnify:CR=1 FL=1
MKFLTLFGGHNSTRFINEAQTECPPNAGWRYIPDQSNTSSYEEASLQINVVGNPVTECDRKLQITNSEKSHISSIYNDIYELFSEDGKPVYKSRGQFPIKTIKWDDENSMWTISGQVGGRV